MWRLLLEYIDVLKHLEYIDVLKHLVSNASKQLFPEGLPASMVPVLSGSVNGCPLPISMHFEERSQLVS